MEAISPATGAEEIIFAKDQPEYAPLPVAVYTMEYAPGMEGTTLLTRWRFSEEERQRIAAGEDLYLACITFGQPLQPLNIQVGGESPTSWAEFVTRDVPA
jgi:hypothetical protein